MRKKVLANVRVLLDERTAEVEKLHNGAKTFCAVCLLCRGPYLQVVVHDEHSCVIEDPVKVDNCRRPESKFGAFSNLCRPLEQPIEANEVNSAMKKFNCASGYDSLPGEFIKYAASQLNTSVAAIFNKALEHH